MYNRVIEKQKFEKNTADTNSYNLPVLYVAIEDHNKLPFLLLSDRLFKSVTFKESNTTINTFNIKDKYIILKNPSKILYLQSKDNIIQFAVNNFLNCTEFFSKPILSIIIGIYKVNTTKLSDIF